jgi:hypothetical protein
MSSRSYRFALPVITLFSLAFLAACGNNAHSPVPPPTGAFSNTNFNGAYTFSLLGVDGNGTFAMAGTLTACGCSAGTISGGSADLVDPSGLSPAATINGGNYNVTADGRGKIGLTITPQGGAALQVTLDFVLTSSSHGLIIRFDNNGTGSGTIDSQPSSVSQTALAGPYAFSFSGVDGIGNPLATVGAFTLDSAGTIAASPAGVEDFTRYNVASLSGTAYPALPLTGSVLVGSGTAPGTASLNTGVSGFGNLSFDVYVIDSTHLKLIESDGVQILVGDVFAQTSASIPSSNLVFTMAGIDTAGFPFAVGGLMTSDGVSQITNGAEDINDGGLVDGGTNPATPINFGGSFIAAGNGRFQFNLSNFGGGATFAAYPSVGGLLIQEIDNGASAGITAGVALTQSATSVASSSGYGMNLTGADLINNIELDEIAQFQTTSSTFTNGLLDENDGGPESVKNFSGAYSVGSNGAGSATNLNSGLQSMFFYVADTSTVVFISTDPNQVAVGAFQTQSTPSAAQAAVVQRHLAMLRSVPRLAKRKQTRNAK